MAYYYLISSLPMLKADADMPFSYEQFLAMCKSALSESKYELLKELSLEKRNGALLSAWSDFYCSMKEELTYQRNLRLGRKAVLPSKREESITKIVLSAMNNNNPLEAEKMLLSFQFEKLDALIGTHYFDDYALFGYALKLKLLERKTIFKQESGKKEFSRIADVLEKQIIS